MDVWREGMTRGRPRLGAPALLVACGLLAACAPPEDPARAELRGRLRQEARLTDEEIGRVRAEVSGAIAGKTVEVKDAAGERPLTAEQRAVAFEILTNAAGVFDEGLQRENGRSFRVLNGPGRSDNAEIEATNRLWIDVDTFLPYRFRFAYAFPGYGDYTLELVVSP
jgi:hypothetical protein